MTSAPAEPSADDWRHFIPAALLSFAAVGLFLAAIFLLNIPAAMHDSLPRLTPPRDALAQIGGFIAYRGYAALAVTACVAVSITSLIALWILVPAGRARTALVCTFCGIALLAMLATSLGGSAMAEIATRMTCRAEAGGQIWEFCALKRVASLGPLRFHYAFNNWIDAACAVAMVTVLFAIFVAALSRPNPQLPEYFSSPERSVSTLLIAGSTALVSVMLLQKGFLHWAFAEFLALEKPPKDVTAYIAGTASFNGALSTSLLAFAWFASLLLLRRGGAAAGAGEGAAPPGSFSGYNLSAIAAPVLSAIGANLLGIQ